MCWNFPDNISSLDVGTKFDFLATKIGQTEKTPVYRIIFSSPDEVKESLCCHPVVGVGVGVGVGVSTYKLIDYNSNIHLLTPLIFGTHMPWDKTFLCMSKF